MAVEPSWPAELESVLEHLSQPDPTLAPRGSPTLALLSRLHALLRTPTPRALAHATHLASHLVRLADDLLNSVPYKDVPLATRRLYTDAALLGALARLAPTATATATAAERAAQLHQAVRDCDLAIVIAGAPGEHREDLALDLVRVAQARLGALGGEPDDDGPFLVRAALADSDAVARWRSLAYLRAVAGPARVVPVEVGGDYAAEGWSQRLMDFGAFVDALERAEEEDEEEEGEGEGREGKEEDEEEEQRERPETLYLAQHALFRQFPTLRRDLPLPDLVYSPPDRDNGGGNDGAEYVPPQSDDGVVLNAWLGPRGTTSRAHTDPYWNCYVQVVGSKWVWVAPPECAPHMAAFGGGSTGAGGGEGEQAAQSYMTNTSTLDVSVPPPPPGRAPSPSPPPPPPSTSTSTSTSCAARPAELLDEPAPRAAYPPAFLAEVRPRAFQAVLEPGDVLVLPPGWWHSLVSLETSFSVSMWF
ncbi:uncharacterized protein RHOBADRAFT_56132 [Rhodotorula graminis WP1]|uniref:JmjC domain-containing protein n=1 Tax=Rhodotorula graminis (strain WP1) TaxID=578459 RepID=A0A0P9ERF1_RHOGW|nr:uncharacterized protein RHOBADRAFT_56132 [Rhodotorula graminis WP1]KPV71991.1 hypothetical protein RHOBADRAFT_56132 [Rhodotorula graminis WP1]